jgi:hypothetical protein
MQARVLEAGWRQFEHMARLHPPSALQLPFAADGAASLSNSSSSTSPSSSSSSLSPNGLAVACRGAPRSDAGVRDAAHTHALPESCVYGRQLESATISQSEKPLTATGRSYIPFAKRAQDKSFEAKVKALTGKKAARRADKDKFMADLIANGALGNSEDADSSGKNPFYMRPAGPRPTKK